MENKFSLNGVKARWAGSAAVLLLTLGMFGGSPALAGIASTKHNLGSLTTGPNRFSGTAEVCVFCHTPHGADATASVPLWNKTLPSAATYTTYNSLGTSSLDGATVPVGSVSIACLSCHDGVQAMNTVINAPGSSLAGNAAWAGGTWTNGTGKITSTAANLSAILNNDHPIGIQYGGGMVGNAAYTAGAIASAAFKDKDFVGLQYASLNGNPVWWVDSGATANSRDKGDMQLYTRTGATALSGTSNTTTGGTVLSGAQAFVECGSCHDPHVDNTVTFLRISNANSAVCLACHIK